VDDIPSDSEALAKNIGYHAKYTASTSPLCFTLPQAYLATAQSVEERLVERWDSTYTSWETENPKMAYYLSMEYLHGRTLSNGIRNIGLKGEYEDALLKFGHKLEEVEAEEKDAGLGNGGLGRLASCFLDSSASLNLPVWGYGMRYKYGLFKQKIEDGLQTEVAEDWLDVTNPWEIKRDQVTYPVGFFGEVKNGKWVPGEEINATAYDVPIPGYNTTNTISLRLWNVESESFRFDLESFNSGSHLSAHKSQITSEDLCSVLYPGDDSMEGKELRLRQQYFLCSASMQDIVSTFKRRQLAQVGKVNWQSFSEKVSVQMNDTHPALSAPELMRILMDVEGLNWSTAWKIVTKSCNYTNHTILPEALEAWSMQVLQTLLPRHMEIITQMDKQFRSSLKKLSGESSEDFAARLENMAILKDVDPVTLKKPLKVKAGYSISGATEEDSSDSGEPLPEPVVRMANMSVISAAHVNGVAALHTEIVKAETFNDFYNLWPEKFQNKTNGVTPRRWLAWCNPELSKVISKWLGTEDWISDLTLLKGLEQHAESPELHAEWKEAKLVTKTRLAAYVKEKTGYDIPLPSMFDTQIKRIHEYKRQLLNIMAVAYRYKKIKAMSAKEKKDVVPKVVMIGGKAFATYVQAKRIVQLIVAVADKVNNDPAIGDLLKVVFLPNYNVSVAEVLIPGTDVCQQISTAGMEASGTSNMKFMMNGSLTIGTLDGANVEIREEAGPEHFFLFGATADEIPGIREDRAAGKFVPHPLFSETMDFIKSGVFGETFEELLGSLEGNEGFGRGDYFCVGHDFASYVEQLDAVDEHWKDQDKWVTSSIINTANSGKFSSDRTIGQYASEIWGVKPNKTTM
jgi:starch phosphorylase